MNSFIVQSTQQRIRKMVHGLLNNLYKWSLSKTEPNLKEKGNMIWTRISHEKSFYISNYFKVFAHLSPMGTPLVVWMNGMWIGNIYLISSTTIKVKFFEVHKCYMFNVTHCVGWRPNFNYKIESPERLDGKLCVSVETGDMQEKCKVKL